MAYTPRTVRYTIRMLIPLLVLLVSGCSALFAPDYPALPGEELPIASGVTFVNRSADGGQTSLSVDTGSESTDLYLIFTNPGDQPRSGIRVTTPTARAAASVPPANATVSSAPSSPPADHEYAPGNPALVDWPVPPLEPSTSATRSLTAAQSTAGPGRLGDQREFFSGTSETSRLRAELVHVTDDRRGPSGYAVEFWVETGELGRTGGVSPEMITALAPRFLTPGTPEDDILDWVTGMLGSPWGATPYANLIGDTRTISILIYNMESNGPGGMVGFYWSKDSFDRRAVPFSNERIMFYIDSESLSASSGFDWEITDRWPASITSTLAHELQHMIHFYQRFVLRGANSETWLNETMSLMVEDIVSEKLSIPGPRGVCPATYATGSAGAVANNTGRIPRYNSVNYRSLTAWGNTESVLDSYSLTYSFGAYLARNFGGAELLAAMMESSSSNAERVIQEAIATQGYSNGTLEELLWRWGVSTLRSDSAERQPFMLNTGGWSDARDSFVLGAINHYNYTSSAGSGPRVFTGDISDLVLEPGAKLIYLVATAVSGPVELTVSAGAEIDFAVVENAVVEN